MKKTILVLTIGAISLSAQAKNASVIHDEASLNIAIAAANSDSSINKLTFKKNAHITLTAPVIYNGTQSLTLAGRGATINGENLRQ
jgi:hypothetical protein